MADLSGLAELGKIGGIAAIVVGALVLIFRDLVRSKVLRPLSPRHSYALLRLVVFLLFLGGIAGLTAWWYAQRQLELAQCAPVIRPDPNRILTTQAACQGDTARADAQAIASAQVVREEVANLVRSQAPYFTIAILTYAEAPSKDRWTRVVEHRRFVDSQLIPAIRALTQYESKVGRTTSTKQLSRLLSRRIAYLSRFDESKPMTSEEARTALVQYQTLTRDTVCALSDLLAERGEKVDTTDFPPTVQCEPEVPFEPSNLEGSS